MDYHNESSSTNIFDVGNISDFLVIWLEQDLLSGEEKKVFDSYYYSYKKLFDEYIKFHYSQQTKELMDILGKFDRPKCIDIGCGCGIESLWMAYREEAVVTGIDIIQDRLNVARRCKEILEMQINKSLSCSFKKCSLFDIKGKNKFDIIWMEMTLHHLEPRAMALDKISELVKDGGFVVITEVNAWNPLLQAEFVLKRGFSTVKEYFNYIEESRMLFEISIFSYSLKVQTRNNKKIYCIDNGLRNAVSFQFSKDEGRLAENLVFIELKRKEKEIYYWKNNVEVDFIIKNKDNSLTAINVSYTNKINKREINSLLKFKKEFQKTKELILLTKDLEKTEQNIKFIPLWKWLLKSKA